PEETPAPVTPDATPAIVSEKSVPATSEAAPKMTPEKPVPVEEKLAASTPPPTPPAPAEPAPAPATPVPAAAPVAPRTQVTLVQGIGVALPSGQVSLPAGTHLRFLALEGQNVRVAWNTSVFYVPAVATDIGNDPSATPAAAAVPPKKPADDP